jgi:CHRD domain
MSALRISLFAFVVLAASSFSHDRAHAIAQGFAAILYGGNEVAGTVANVGDPDGYGFATVNFVGRTRLCFTIYVIRIDTPTMAHIHRGPAGVGGGIVIPLAPPPSGNPGQVEKCIRGLDKALVKEIKANPDQFYVNVHTGQFSNGALRGQLF